MKHALWARSEISAAGNGRRADPQVHPEPAETRAGGRAPAQRRVGCCGGRQQPAAAAGECGASSLPPRAPRAARGPTPGLPEQPGCPCPCRPPLPSPALPPAPFLRVPLALSPRGSAITHEDRGRVWGPGTLGGAATPAAEAQRGRGCGLGLGRWGGGWNASRVTLVLDCGVAGT